MFKTTNHNLPNYSHSEGEVLIKVEGVSKKFCRDLKKSLWYGVKDMAAELLPFGSQRSSTKSYLLSGSSNGHSPTHNLITNGSTLRPDEFWAVNNVSFELKRGECLGLVGRNGAGKTTLLRMLNGLIKPDRGRIEMRGRVGALIALGAGFNPILTGRENIYVNGAVLGLTKREIDEKIDDIIDFAEIREFIDSSVQSYSSGMQVRLGFAVATALEPDVLLLDEVLAVGDTAFRGKCFKRIGDILSKAAVIFVSHNEPQVARICSKALLMNSGTQLFLGSAAEALRLYRNQHAEPSRSLQLVRDPRVESVELLRQPHVVEWGANLDLEVGVHVTQDVSAGYLLIHWARHGEFVANSELRCEPTQPLHLGIGTHTLSFSVGPVHLVHGKYYLSLSIFDPSGKNTILQAVDFTSIEVAGPIGSGPSNLLPMALRVRNARRPTLEYENELGTRTDF